MLADGDIEFMRKSHEALMYDRVRITRDGVMEWDEELHRMVETRNMTLYEGKARVFLEKSDGIVIGESTATVNRTQGYVTIPAFSVETLGEGDKVIVTSAQRNYPTLYVTSVGEDAFKPACIRFAVVTDRNQLNVGDYDG